MFLLFYYDQYLASNVPVFFPAPFLVMSPYYEPTIPLGFLVQLVEFEANRSHQGMNETHILK